MAFNLEHKVGLVTGGSKGIGASICEVLAKHGCDVQIVDIDAEQGLIVEKAIRENGGKATFRYCDISEQAAVAALFTEVEKQYGQLNLLINNAGIAQIGNVEQTTPEDMKRMYDVNIMGVYHCLHFGLPLMKKAKGGAIVNMSSVAAQVGLADRFGYTMSKGAVQSMTYSVAKDYLADHIRCNAVGPGRVHTPFVDGYLKANYPGREAEMFEQLSKTQPIGRMGSTEEVAHLVLYLCSDEAAFCTGGYYPIDGGFKTLNT